MSTADDVTSPTLDAALSYARRGWRVIQLHSVGPDGVTCSCRKGGNCTSKGKHPRDNAWQKAPRASAADIHALWEERPKANVGIATGSESGIFVLDLDPKDNGIESFKELLAEGGGEMPLTYTAQTGSGGYHYYFAMPDFEVRNSQSKLAPGVDIRGEGGQVVVAPSRTDKGSYAVVRDVEVAQAPAWLLELLKPDERQHDVITAEDLPRPEDISPEEWDRLNAYSRKAIDANLAELDALGREGWDGKPWDATTFSVSCALIEIANSPWNAYSLGQAEADVLAHAPRDTDGFDTWKVKQKFSSAREKVGDKARAIPVSRTTTDDADDLFAGPDVRRREAPPADPTGGPSTTPGGAGGPSRFFEKGSDLKAAVLAHAVMAEGPLGYGQDKDFWAYDDGVWLPAHDIVEDRCIDLLGNKFRTGHVTTVKPIIRKSAVQIEADSPDPRFLNFRNGMLNWKTGEMLGHDPNFKSVVQFPHDYLEDAECPVFDAFLADVLHEDFVPLAWEMLGYLLFSGNPRQVAFMFYGSGSNGKGTLMRVIEDMLGKENIASESLDDLNGNRFSAINLYGKIANLAGDIDGTYQESTANFKKLTGEDTYAGERKFGDRFNFESWAVPVFSANKIPGSADVTEGYLRRWVILHFHKHITARIDGFSDRLVAEMPGIIAKAVRALKDLMANSGFSINGRAKRVQEEFAEAIDQVRQWVASGDPIVAPEHHQPVADLYSAYCIWAGRAGVSRLKEQEFSHRLEAIGYPKQRLAGVIGHVGLRAEVGSHSSLPSASFF